MGNEWVERNVEEVANVFGGGTPSTKDEANFNGEIPWITPKDLSGYPFRYISRGERNISKKGLNCSNAKLLPVGTVLLTTRAPVGYVAIAANPVTTNQGFHSLVPHNGYSSEFIYYLLKANAEYLKSNASGTTFGELSGSTLKRLKFVFPSIPEQRAIADVLGSLDDKIELNRRMNATLESMARAVFKAWFVENEEAKGWEAGQFSDIAQNIRRGVNPADVSPEMPYIGLEHMPRRSIALSEWGRAGDVTSNKFKFQRGEILFGKLRPYFHKVGIAPINGVCSTDVLVVAPKNPEDFGLVLGYISSEDFVNSVNAASEGTKMPRTNWDTMARYPITIPDGKLAADFTAMVQPMIEKIQNNIDQSRTLAALRDALLPRLMSGEVRVKDLEEIR